MKRAIIRSSGMVLVVLAVAIGINAQSSQQYRAEIPFSFEAKGQHHSAGVYRVGEIGSGAIGLLNLKSGKMRILSVTTQPGNNNGNNRGTVTFLRTNGRYLLSEISTPSFRMKMKVKKIPYEAGEVAAAEQVIKIYLD